MKSILPLPHTNWVLLLYVVPTVTKQGFLLLLIWHESEEDWALTDIVSNFYCRRASQSMPLMVLSGDDIPRIKKRYNKTTKWGRAVLVISLKMVCYKLKTHYTQYFHQEFGVPDVFENLLKVLVFPPKMAHAHKILLRFQGAHAFPHSEYC